MKFVCDNCSTQYLISDDKIGPKGVKVRCKRCGNTIVLRPPAEEEHQPEPPPESKPFSAEGEGGLAPGGSSDEVGQAFDQLLASARNENEDSDWDESEYQATEIFDVNRLKEQLQDEFADDSADLQIDRVFASAASTGVKPQSDTATEAQENWYVAISDEQVGPLARAEVEARWAAGEVNAGSLAWRQGMDNWTPIANISELAFLLDSQQAQAEQPAEESSPLPQTDDDEWGAFEEKSSELAALVDDEIAAPEKAPAVTDEIKPDQADQAEQDPWAAMEADVGADDEGDAGSAADEGVPPWERDQVESGEVARPDDNFFDSSLDQPADDEEEGLFDSGGTYSRSGRVLAGPAYLGDGNQRRSPTKTIVLVSTIVFLLGVVGAGGWYLLHEPEGETAGGQPGGDVAVSGSDKAKPTPTSKQTKAKQTKSTRTAAGKTDSKKSGPESGKDSKTDTSATNGSDGSKKPEKSDKNTKDADKMVVAKAKVPSKPVKNPRTKIQRTKQKPKGRTEKKRERKPVAKAAADKNKRADSDSGLPERLDNSQIKSSMGRKLAAFKMCVRHGRERDPNLTGKLVVKFTIMPGGNVGATSVVSKQHEKSFVAGCILHVIKSVRFPKFSGKPITIPGFPFKL